MMPWLSDFLQECLDFSNVLNASIAAGWMILAVLVLRLLLRKAPKWLHVALWGLVALRLLLPFPIESVFSLIPSTETLPSEILAYGPVRHQEPARLDIITNPVFSEPVSVTLPQTVDRVQGITMNWSFLWLAGIAVMLIYTLVSYLRLRRRVREACLLRENIYQCAAIPSPFVLGLLRPRIYLPYGITDPDMTHVIAHEQAHIRRKDHWWKPLGFLLLSIHWFNPLMWLAYILLCRDIELACDEKVIKALGRHARADYSQALLKCSVSHRSIAACPLAFGEVGVKDRVRNVLHYRKPAFWLILAAVLACLICAVCFLTDPVNSSVVNPWTQEYVPGTGNILGNVDKAAFEAVSPDFAIGADQYGRAVFKDPNSALSTLKDLYAEALDLIREQEDLPPLTRRTVNLYKKFGWQLTSGTEEQKEQARFVTRFLDIYENSFDESIPVSDEDMEPTKQVLSLDKVTELAQKGKNLDWADFEGYVSESVGSGLYILRYEIDDVFHLIVGGVPDEAPWYVRLCTNSTDEYIDLTENDPLPFVSHYSGDYTAENLSALENKTTCTVTSQEQKEIALSIRSAALTDSCYTEAGQDFAQGDVIAYQDSNTRIWLSRVQRSNESEDQLYFTFRCAYALGDNGSVLSTIRFREDGSTANAVSMGSKVIKTGWDAYPDGVSLRGEGPGQQFTLYVSAEACRAIEGRMAFQVELNEIHYQKKLIGPENAAGSLDTAISAAILEHFDTDGRDGLIHVESHVLLANEQKLTSPFLFWKEQRVEEETVYLLVLHESFRTDSGAAEPYGGSYVPTAITFRVEEDGSYTLKEYWEPRDGSQYSEDILRKFPEEAAELCFRDMDGCSVQLEEENLQKVTAYIDQHGTTYTTVEYLLKQVLPTDTTAKNPQLWLEESPEEYRALLDLGTGTVYYCFSQFLEGGQTDMRGQIMALLCRQLMEQWGESYDLTGGGQDWFDAFRWKAESLLAEEDPEVLQKHNPAVWMLMEMTAAVIPAPASFVFGDTDDLMPPTVTLLEDGSFWFHFSAVSSYIGHGKYTIENSRLILPTEDGMFTYYFDILDENTLAFDAEASSDMVWYSNLKDGSRLYKDAPSSTSLPMTSLEELPEDYNAEQAQIDGCILMRDNWVFSGDEIWERFVSDTRRGTPAFLRVFRDISDREGSGYEKDLYDVTYDGSRYTLRVRAGDDLWTGEFTHLRYFYGEVTDGSQDYDAIERYVLTNDPDASWEEIWRSAASSRYGDLIEHFVIYSDLFYYPDHPAVPELAAAALELDGEVLISISDPDALNRLEALLSSAEGLGYEPKTYFLGPELVLTAADGSVQRYALNILSDLIVVDGIFYDYGPGYTDVGAYDGTEALLAVFGLEYWPDAVYDKYGEHLGPIPTGPRETEPIDLFPGGGILVWYPDLTCQELDYAHPISTLLEALAEAELEPTNETQPDLQEAEYTLHIAYDNGEEFDLVYDGNGLFFYRVFRTQQTYTFTSYDLHDLIQTAIDAAS